MSVAPSTMSQSHFEGTGVMNAVVDCLVGCCLSETTACYVYVQYVHDMMTWTNVVGDLNFTLILHLYTTT